MIRRLTIIAIFSTFLVSCSSTDKQSGGDDPITSKSMTFDASGSDSGGIDGLNSINFEFDRANLTSATKSTLDQNAGWINSHPGVAMQVEGHCDMRGSLEYNLALGERRAKAVKNYLVSKGVDPNRLSVISYGKEKLLDSGDSEDSHYRNRRANFVPLSN